MLVTIWLSPDCPMVILSLNHISLSFLLTSLSCDNPLIVQSWHCRSTICVCLFYYPVYPVTIPWLSNGSIVTHPYKSVFLFILSVFWLSPECPMVTLSFNHINYIISLSFWLTCLSCDYPLCPATIQSVLCFLLFNGDIVTQPYKSVFLLSCLSSDYPLSVQWSYCHSAI